MSWFNLHGLLFVLIILIPNILFSVTRQDGFQNKYHNKTAAVLEQLGRFGCFGFMFLSIPVVCRGFWFHGADSVYLISGACLVLLYCLGWIVFWKEDSVKKALTLSILPSLLFLESGIVTCNLPLIFFAVIFAVCHITISYKNAVLSGKHTDSLTH